MERDSDDSNLGEIRRFVASDGYTLHYRRFAPLDIVRGYVVALHGIQSHAGWYGYSSSRIAEAGFDVRFLDRRGSGLNAESSGHAPHADRLINDIAQFLLAVRHERDSVTPGVPVVLLGLSWGGKPAAVTAGRRPELVEGLALLYPGLAARIRPKWHQRLLLRLAARSKNRHRRVSIPLDDPALFTDDPTWQAFIRNDPLALHEATVGLLNASLDLDTAVQVAGPGIRCPALLMLAGGDRIIDNAAVRRTFNRFASPQRTLLEYPNAAHTLEFAPNRAAIFSDLTNWLGTVAGEFSGG